MEIKRAGSHGLHVWRQNRVLVLKDHAWNSVLALFQVGRRWRRRNFVLFDYPGDRVLLTIHIMIYLLPGNADIFASAILAQRKCNPSYL